MKIAGPELPQDWHQLLKRGRGVVAEMSAASPKLTAAGMERAMAHGAAPVAALTMAQDGWERRPLLAGEPLFVFCTPAAPLEGVSRVPATAFALLSKFEAALLRHPFAEPREGRKANAGFKLRPPELGERGWEFEYFLPGEWLWEEAPGLWRARLLVVDRPFVEGVAHGLGSPVAREGEFPLVLAEAMVDEWASRTRRRVEEALRGGPGSAAAQKPAPAEGLAPTALGIPLSAGLPGAWIERF